MLRARSRRRPYAGCVRFVPVLAVFLFAGSVAATEDGGLVLSEHLEVRGSAGEAWLSKAARLGEALHTALTKHFGRAPDVRRGRLRLVLHRDKAAFERVLAEARVPRHTGPIGGYTFWRKGVSHVYVQAHAFDTRRLVLHELTHQFQARLQRPERRGQGAWWYREGLAEYFGWHRETPDGPVFGALDVREVNRRNHEARARTRRAGWNPWTIVEGTRRVDYTDALALVAGLIASEDETVRATFRAWEQEVLARGGDRAAFLRRFASFEPRLAAIVRKAWDRIGPPAQDAQEGRE